MSTKEILSGKKRLGRTELMVSEVAFGGIPVMRLQFDEGVELIEEVIEREVTFLDTAHGYGDSEEKIGAVIEKSERENLILSSKSPGRDKKTFNQHLDLSLARLKTDYIDIYHLHNVSSEDDFERVTAPGGALEGLKDAVEAGKVRFPAVSSHAVDMAVRLIDTGHFDILQFPLNFVDNQGEKDLLPKVKELDIGFIAMKPLGGGLLDDAGLCFRYLQQFPDIIPDPGIERIEELDEIISLYRNKRELTTDERKKITDICQRMGERWCHRCDYCQPCPQGIPISLVLIVDSITKRMTYNSAKGFVDSAMERAAECTECRECVERCPYDLPIPELIREKRKLWQEFAEAHR